MDIAYTLLYYVANALYAYFTTVLFIYIMKISNIIQPINDIFIILLLALFILPKPK